MLDVLASALKNLARKRLRTVLTVSGIMVGVALVVIVTMISSGGKSLLNGELESLGISGLSVSTNAGVSSGKNGIGTEDLQVIRETGNVETAMPLILEYAATELRGLVQDTLICGIDAGAKQAISLELKYGRLIAAGDVSAGSFVCIVDESLARAAYGRDNITGKSIRLRIGNVEEEFRIIGIAAAESSLVQSLGGIIPDMVYIPYSAIQEMTGRDYFDQVAVRVDGAADVTRTESDILKNLQRSTGLKEYFRVDNLSTQRDKLSGLMEIVSAILMVISGISLIVSGLGIMTIMLVSVNERMREIGVKKAIGASNGRILFEFIMEAVIISLLGGVIGIAFGGAVSLAGSVLFGLALPVPWEQFAGLMVFTLLIGTLFGIYPAIKASRLRPVDALRYE